MPLVRFYVKINYVVEAPPNAIAHPPDTGQLLLSDAAVDVPEGENLKVYANEVKRRVDAALDKWSKDVEERSRGEQV